MGGQLMHIGMFWGLRSEDDVCCVHVEGQDIVVCYFCCLLYMYWLLLFSDVYLSTNGSTVDNICQSTPSDGCGCFGMDKVYCTLLRCALKSLGYPLKEIKNPLGINLVFLHDLNWSGRKTRLDLAGSDRDSVRNSIQGICTDLLTVNWEIWSIICNRTLHPPPSQHNSVPVGFNNVFILCSSLPVCVPVLVINWV